MNKFKVGDIIKGNNDMYSYTNFNMIEGEVTKVWDDTYINVKILKHKYDSTGEHKVESRHFLLVEKVKKEEIKKEEGVKMQDVVIKEVGENTYIIINEKYTICVPVKSSNIGISSRLPEDNFNEETGKAIAFYRMLHGGVK